MMSRAAAVKTAMLGLAFVVTLAVVNADASPRAHMANMKPQPRQHCVTAPAGPPRCVQYIGQTCVRTAPNLRTRCWYQ